MKGMPKTIIIMGVSGAGKSEVGRELAHGLDAVFDDADDFHSEEARAKMEQGIPLTDSDRWPWLDRLRARIMMVQASGKTHVLACSALRQVYRNRLRGDDGADQLVFVLLDGDRDLIAERMAARKDHYMPLALLDSQLATLERTEDLVVISIEPPIDCIVEEIARRLATEGERHE